MNQQTTSSLIDLSEVKQIKTEPASVEFYAKCIDPASDVLVNFKARPDTEMVGLGRDDNWTAKNVAIGMTFSDEGLKYQVVGLGRKEHHVEAGQPPEAGIYSATAKPADNAEPEPTSKELSQALDILKGTAQKLIDVKGWTLNEFSKHTDSKLAHMDARVRELAGNLKMLDANWNRLQDLLLATRAMKEHKERQEGIFVVRIAKVSFPFEDYPSLLAIVPEASRVAINAITKPESATTNGQQLLVYAIAEAVRRHRDAVA